LSFYFRVVLVLAQKDGPIFPALVRSARHNLRSTPADRVNDRAKYSFTLYIVLFTK
jgi:hypothetical protein